jgi:hypothetical protein
MLLRTSTFALLLSASCTPFVLGPFPPPGPPQYCAAEPDCKPVGQEMKLCRFLRAYNPDGSLPRAQCVPTDYDPTM